MDDSRLFCRRSASKGEQQTSYQYRDSHTLEAAHPRHLLCKANRLIQSARRRHCSLDGEAANVLPALLQQGDEVVDGQHDVSDELVLRHVHVADSDTHAQHLLQLELDGRLDFGDLAAEVFGVGDWGGELAGCGRSQYDV